MKLHYEIIYKIVCGSFDFGNKEYKQIVQIVWHKYYLDIEVMNPAGKSYAVAKRRKQRKNRKKKDAFDLKV